MHFTYVEPSGESLRQGDLLLRSEKLDEILQAVHPHYVKADYTHFIVLTQSCDLVVRDGRCSSRYISIAAVRPLEVVLRRELEKFQRSDAEKNGNFVNAEDKRHMKSFLFKLFNNNVPEFFYLESEPEAGLQENSCAFLRLSIAIKSQYHYQSCLSARVLSLRESFQAKLGWLVGNIYSRVGTEDWTPENASTEDFKEKINKELNGICMWLEKDLFKQVTRHIKKMRKDNPDMVVSANNIESIIGKVSVPSKKEQLISRSLQILLEQEVIPEEVVRDRKIINALNNDPEISELVR